MDQAEPFCTLKKKQNNNNNDAMTLYDNPNIYCGKVEGNMNTVIIITAETTFVFEINSWLASVAGACPVLSCAVTSKPLLRRLTVGNHCQLKYFIEALHRTEDKNYMLYIRL